MPELKVSELAIYPVKSFAQITLNSAFVDRFGLSQDRRWMVVDESGQFVTQRQYPKMCLVQQVLTEHGIQISAPGMSDLVVSKSSHTIRQKVTVWGDHCNAQDSGDKAAEWVSRFLGLTCRLVFFPENEFRQVDLSYAQAGDQTAFSDGFPLLLISQASLDDLNERLEVPIEMARFRPNLVVDGCDAFAEDGWKRLRVGPVTFRVVKPCSRCVIPCIDLLTGKRGQEPLRTLSRYRRRDNQVYFGQNLIAESIGAIEAGMVVEVLE
ncbi:MAG: MOSC domain-containing protein [Gammaproteobacteria bacterium]|nr:MOSC domain-containing protein [Gammaproteobacteria bacterium]